MSNKQKRKDKKQAIDIKHGSGSSSSKNVLDLRSIVAKKEVEKARRERQLKEIAAQNALKASRQKTIVDSPVRKKRAKKRTDVVHVEVKKPVKHVTQEVGDTMLMDMEKTGSFNRHVASDEEMSFWNSEVLEESTDTRISGKQLRAQRRQQRKQLKSAAREQALLRKKERAAQAKPKQEKPKVVQAKTQRKKKRKQAASLTRPLHDSAIDTAQKKAKKRELPSFGVTFRAIGKPVVTFALIASIFVLPASVSAILNGGGSLEESVTQSAEEAFVHLQQAGNELQGFQFDAAEQEFASASLAFEQANQQIDNLNGVVSSVAKYVPGKGRTFHAGVHLLAAGEDLAAAGEILSAAMQELHTVDLGSVAEDEDTGITSLLLVLHSALVPASEHINSAVEHMNNVPVSAVPEDKRELVEQAQELLPLVSDTVDESLGTIELLLAFLGHEESKRYLVLFQNNHELRPTGGFIGSIALIDIRKGVVTGLQVPGGGVYDVAGQQRVQVISPGPMHLVNPHWNIQDANWFPHFPSSALKVQAFFESAGQPSVDGVITLVPSVIEDLIAATGPIDLTEDFGVIIDENNFYQEVQVRAEEKYDVTRESKRIIGEMTPKLFNNIFAAAENPEQLIEIASSVRDALSRKEILVYMNDEELQQLFSQRDWSGELKQTDRDYLAVIHANIGGGKTSQVVEEVVKHRAEIQEDGRIVNTVTVTRVHKGDPDSILEGVVNTDYVRFYVPEGSTLVSADGFESPDPALFMKPIATYDVDEDLERISGEVLLSSKNGVSTNTEYGKTVFGGWTTTPVNESSTVTISYTLPFTIETGRLWGTVDRYSLLVQKQPGYDVFFTSDVSLPSNMTALEKYPPEYSGNTQMLLTQDFFAGMLIQRN